EQGKLDLDADVNKYITNFQIDDTYPGQPVTMRHIMTHSAGFEDGGLGYLILDDINDTIPLADAMKKYEPARVNAPGAQTAYSNYATSIAGLVVQNLSGQAFNDYVKTNIFDVLGMDSSSFYEPLPENLNDNMAVAYKFEAGKYVAQPFEIVASFSPAGAASATATDMIKFAQAILNGGELDGARILRADTVEQMLTRNFSHDPHMMGLALGFYETEHSGVRLLGHGGDTAFFHSELAIDQSNNLAFFVSFSGAGGSKVRSSFATSFYEAFNAQEIVPVTPPADFAERAGKYAGEYRFWRSSFTKVEKALGITGGLNVAPTANNTLLFAFGASPKEYVEIDKNLFRQVGGESKLAFQENTSGDITGFVIDGAPFMSTYKSPFYLTSGFNQGFLALSLLMFVGVLLKLAYRWKTHREMQGTEKTLNRAVLYTAGLNMLVIIIGAIVLTAFGDRLQFGVPTPIAMWLWLPIFSTIAGFYLAYNAVTVWKDGLLASIWARVRYSLLAAAGLFMAWFYYFWNLLGFNYFS
ncbi:MAG: serine hydrolase, partial [Kordiimonadaceae bacterium]|nr:serine hydrolase [Kordiimonadaceae bacterium]